MLELGAEGEHLAEQYHALKKQKGDAKKREALQERLEAIEADEAVFQKRLAQIDFMIKGAAPAAAGATVSTAAATTSSQQQLQQQPATSGKAFKMPDTKLFPPWNSAGRTEPLDLRRWLLGVARVCDGHHFHETDWRTAVAFLLPSGGVHQDWAWRRRDDITSEPWETFVESFVAAFQQQSSLDILEAECMGCPAARYNLCYCVLCEVY